MSFLSNEKTGDRMRFFFSLSKDNDDIDYESLKEDLVDEFGARMTSITGGLGFCDMCEAEDVSNEELLAMAKREGMDLRKYRK